MAYADEQLFLWINGPAGSMPLIDWIATWICSDYLIPVNMALALIMLWFIEPNRIARERHQIGVFVALTSMALSSFFVFIVNALYFRPRPFETLDANVLFYKPTDSSFPSNAAAAMFGIAIAVFCVHRKMGILLIFLASLHSLSRIYTGIHYPLDILSGAGIAVVVTMLTLQGRNLLMPILKVVMKIIRILCLA